MPRDNNHKRRIRKRYQGYYTPYEYRLYRRKLIVQYSIMPIIGLLLILSLALIVFAANIQL